MVHYTASDMWTRTRASPEGPGTLRTLIRQLIEGVADCHRRNVTHRDLKPENLIVHIPTPDEVEQGGSAAKPVLKLADFGSAVNEESIRFVFYTTEKRRQRHGMGCLCMPPSLDRGSFGACACDRAPSIMTSIDHDDLLLPVCVNCSSHTQDKGVEPQHIGHVSAGNDSIR